VFAHGQGFGQVEPAHLGMCDGKLMYQAVEWYFPGEGQSFNAKQYENVCTGSYVPNPGPGF
jgi:hypothetical protein